MAKPFTIARENLVLLLEQIRVKCLKLPLRAHAKGQAQKLPMKSKRPVNVLMQELSIRVAHLHGKLLPKVLPSHTHVIRNLLKRTAACTTTWHVIVLQ